MKCHCSRTKPQRSRLLPELLEMVDRITCAYLRRKTETDPRMVTRSSESTRSSLLITYKTSQCRRLAAGELAAELRARHSGGEFLPLQQEKAAGESVE